MLFKKNNPAAEPLDPAVSRSEETTTAVSSENVSVADIEHEKERQPPTNTADARSVSSSESRRKVETTGLEEAKALDHMEDETEYPSGAKLGFITFALCISVFLMALVRDVDV